MKILLSSYACEPNRGSEAEIGWGVALELAKANEVWVLTRTNNEPVHTSYFNSLEGGKPSNLKFIYYDLPRWASFYKRKSKNFLIYYYHWQLCSSLTCNKIYKEKKIDVVHHITGGMDFFPSGLSFLKAPFVWGPIGGEDTHPEILRNLPFNDKLKEYKRILLRGLLRRLDLFTWYTKKRADHVITYSSENADSAHKYYKPIKYKMSKGVQTGLILDGRYKMRKTDFKRGDVFTVFYAANLIPWKGGRFVVDAFIQFSLKKDVNARLVIIGTGPLERDMKDALRDAGVQDKVIFKGWLEMQDLIDIMPNNEVFLYPTYHHGLANICLQSMVMGLPLICLEGDGIETVLEHGGGIVVKIDTYESIGAKLSDALYKLYVDDELRITLSKDAQSTIINKFSYTKLTSELIPVYKQTIRKYNETHDSHKEY